MKNVKYHINGNGMGVGLCRSWLGGDTTVEHLQSVSATFHVPAPFDSIQSIITNDGGNMEIKGVHAFMPLDDAYHGHCKTSRRFREGVFAGRNKPRSKLMQRVTVEACGVVYTDHSVVVKSLKFNDGDGRGWRVAK